MSAFCRDVKHTFRILARNRGFAAAVLVTIALGVGGAATVFSVVHGVLLQPLPYPQPDRLVRLWEVHRGADAPVEGLFLSTRTYQTWTRSSATLETLGAFEAGMHTVANAAATERLVGARVTPSLFRVLRVAAAHGRLFDDADADKGASRVVVLTHATWRGRFGSGPVLGTLLTIDGEDHRIVGVARLPRPACLAFCRIPWRSAGGRSVCGRPSAPRAATSWPWCCARGWASRRLVLRSAWPSPRSPRARQPASCSACHRSIPLHSLRHRFPWSWSPSRHACFRRGVQPQSIQRQRSARSSPGVIVRPPASRSSSSRGGLVTSSSCPRATIPPPCLRRSGPRSPLYGCGSRLPARSVRCPPEAIPRPR